MFNPCYGILSVPCSHAITCWEMAGLLALLCFLVFSLLSHMVFWVMYGTRLYLIESIPDLCLPLYFTISRESSGSKTAKIRNRYNQILHLTQATIWESDKNTRKQTYKRAKRSSLSQQVTTRLQGTDNSYTCAFLRKITNLKTSSAAI